MAGHMSATISANTSFNSQAKGKKAKAPGKGFDWSAIGHGLSLWLEVTIAQLRALPGSQEWGRSSFSQSRVTGYQNKEAKDSS